MSEFVPVRAMSVARRTSSLCARRLRCRCCGRTAGSIWAVLGHMATIFTLCSRLRVAMSRYSRSSPLRHPPCVPLPRGALQESGADGIDVVLNSLSHDDYIPRSLALLKKARPDRLRLSQKQTRLAQVMILLCRTRRAGIACIASLGCLGRCFGTIRRAGVIPLAEAWRERHAEHTPAPETCICLRYLPLLGCAMGGSAPARRADGCAPSGKVETQLRDPMRVGTQRLPSARRHSRVGTRARDARRPCYVSLLSPPYV